MRVRAGRYEYPARPCDPYPRFGRNIIVPQLYLKGRWLEQAGFTLHAQVRIVVSWGRWVIEVQGTAEQRPRASI